MSVKGIILGEPAMDPSLLEKSLKEVDIQIPVIPHRMMENQQLVWCRDHTVALPNGTHLLGFSRFGFHIMEILASIPPNSPNMNDYIELRQLGDGICRSETTTEKIKAFFQENQIPFRDSHCAFDGGNILFFSDDRGKQRAIVGFNSVISTYVALKVNGFYEKNKIPLNINVQPSEEAYYIARNQSWRRFYHEYEIRFFQKTAQPNDEIKWREYRQLTHSPLTIEQMKFFHANAVEIEKQLRIAQEELRKEFAVGDLIVIPQRSYHIDMQLLPLNGRNVVFFHHDHDPNFVAYSKKIEAILKSHALIPKPLFGRVKINLFQLNLFNSLQIGDAMIIPTSPSNLKQIDDHFIEALKAEGMKIARIKLPRNTIALYQGGLHCFTTFIFQPK